MCGILGRFARHGNVEDIGALSAATNLLIHRGPDDGAWWSDGSFFLGHRRLSIIDLAQGSQPMATSDGRYVITFNGEIYNFIEVREQLVREGLSFATDSDTEVILQGYRHWGTSVARHLIGMFAFAIADRLEGSLYVARDRFGEKPLFVYETDSSVCFASELGALVGIPGVARRLDTAALGGYLCLNYVPGSATLMQGIRRLPPATWRLYTRTHAHQEAYWCPPPAVASRTALSERSALVELRKRIDEATLLALRSDVPGSLVLIGRH